MQDLATKLKNNIGCEVASDDSTLDKFSRDASIFDVKPQAVVFPKDEKDIKSLVKFVSGRKKSDRSLSLTVRAAGTDMSGGPLSESIIVSVSAMNEIKHVGSDYAIVEPGVYYRDFEKEILKHDLVYPPYTSSKNICAVGGLVANNAGGEKSLLYGKAEDYVQELKAVLSDGNEYTFGSLDKNEVLKKKMSKKNFEGELYNKLYKILDKNMQLIQNSKPKVSKNSCGYNIWRVWDGQTFDISKLFVGSQGTLGIITEINFRLLPRVKHQGMLVIYLDNFEAIPEIVQLVLSHNPDSFETFDHHTLRLALKYFYGFTHAMHTNIVNVTKQFLPEFWDVAFHGMPKLVLLVEFENDDLAIVHQNLDKLNREVQIFKDVRTRVIKNKRTRDKFWAIRRESFNLLRLRVKERYASPFIDDTCVDPKVLPEFFPKIYKILNDNDLLYTIAGHIGNGNFHIIPLVDIRDKSEVDKIYRVNDEVFDLVLKYGGSLSGEHNDGLIRTPYVEKMYGKDIYKIFEEIKEIFDPLSIFNPGKKVDGSIKFAKDHIRTVW